MSRISVLCTAQSEPQAGRIVEDLRGSYYSKHGISVLFPDKRSDRRVDNLAGLRGTAAGGLLGGVLGWLTGAGCMAVPGAGPCIAAGPLLVSLGGAPVGGVAGALVGLGIPDHQARHYEGKVCGGRVLITVHAKDSEEARFAKEIFKHQGADDICSTEDQLEGVTETRTFRRQAQFSPSHFNFW